MGWRMHKRVRICKGLHLNVSKRGLSVSSRTGPITVNSRGIVSACIPGTGLTWREHFGSSKASGGGGAAAAQPTATGRYYLILLAVSSGVIGILGVIAGLSDVSVANTDPTPTTTQPPAVVELRITTPASPKPPTAEPTTTTTQLAGFAPVAPSPSLADLFANDPFIEEGMK
nr:hypothetical protein 9 [bacterium]